MSILEMQTFKQKNLVLNVYAFVDPKTLDIDQWAGFINRLCGDREYQKQAIRSSVIFLASQRYSSIRDLVQENYSKNTELQKKYSSIDDYYSQLQMPEKLCANIDLATGSGKSYVIYGIAQIMLGLGIVDRVLVLCPSVTIEQGLTEKFESLSGNVNLKESIPLNAKFKNPRIINATESIIRGDICIENIHAVYSNTGSSIEDSLKGQGESVLILNDESHHIFNKNLNYTGDDSAIKKWKDFLLSKDYNFKYMLGFTGTAYIDDEYFNDVISRYSLRDAIESKVVKNIDYVKEDDSTNDYEKFQKIYQNHKENCQRYPLVKALTILVTKDVAKAKTLEGDLLEFLCKKEKLDKKEISERVLIVTSHKEHKQNAVKLKYVDSKDSKVEWIVSVSMLTEGWDVKNVFQIVPWEDRAFNSKLLVAQVLGRGLRIPPEYSTPQPKVVVFNHKSWSSKIKKLVDEILEIEARISSNVLTNGDRSKYNFTIHNINYEKSSEEVDSSNAGKTFDYTRMLQEGIELESQSLVVDKETTFVSVTGNVAQSRNYSIDHVSYSIDEVLDQLYDSFDQMEWEGKTLQLGETEYTQNNLPPRSEIEKIIRLSMQKRGNLGDLIVEKNRIKILNSFNTLLRRSSKSIVYKSIGKEIYEIHTTNISKYSAAVGNFKTKDYTLFVSSNWENDISEPEQLAIINEIFNDDYRSVSTIKEINEYYLKTPLNVVISNCEPERKFIDFICKKDNSMFIDSWIKSRDRGFFEIEYSLRLGSKGSKTRKYTHKTFNPDFFLLIRKDEFSYFLVVETKADKDDSDENKAKYKFAKDHFETLNKSLQEQGISERYLFHYLSPSSYTEFFDHLKNNTMFDRQDSFKSELETLLELE